MRRATVVSIGLTLAATSLVLPELSRPAAAQQAAAPTATSVNELAGKLTAVAARLTELQQGTAVLASELTAAENQITLIGGTMAADQRTASELQASAKRQVLAAYVRAGTDTKTSAEAVFAHSDINDQAWAIQFVQITNGRTIDQAKAATQRRAQADGRLVAAISARDRTKAALLSQNEQITAAREELKASESELTNFVATRVAPVTTQSMTTVAYDAYRRAASEVGLERPSCGLRWELLGAIGRTESNHGMGRLDISGTTRPPILGPSIGGDTDGGALDGDPNHDYAVGPMQFIPSTWRTWGTDGNGDGRADMNNIYDEALAAGRYLCSAAGALTLTTREGVTRAILAYNPNQEYLRTVGARYEALAQDVARGWFSTVDLATPPAPTPDSGVPATGVTGNPAPPPPDVTTPADPATETKTVTLFSAGTIAVPVDSTEPLTGTCDEPSSALTGRDGALRCRVSGASVSGLDPCFAAPFDATLAVCVGDPEQPVRQVRVPTALAITGRAPAPPWFLLVLKGGDRCLPFAPAPDAPATPTTTAPTTTAPATTAPATTVPASSSTTSATPVTTSASLIAPPTPPTSRQTLSDTSYRCTSGAEIVGQPDRSQPTWTVQVRQAGIAVRAVSVVTAFA